MALMRQLGDFFRAHKETIQGGYFGAANLRGTELESAASTGRLHSLKEDLPERPFVLQSEDFPPLPNHRAPASKSRTSVRTLKALTKKSGRRPANRRSQGSKENRRKVKRTPGSKAVDSERATLVSRFIYLKLSLSPDAAPVAYIPKSPNPPARNPSNPQSVSPIKTTICCQSERAKASARGPLPTRTTQSRATFELPLEQVPTPSYLQAVLSTASKVVRSALQKTAGSLVSLCTWVLGPHFKTAHPLQRLPGSSVENPVPS